MLGFLKKLLNTTQPEQINFKKRGNDFLATGDMEQAEQCYRQHITAHPDDAEGYVNLGFVLFEQNRFSEAEFLINQAIKIDNKNSDSFYMLGKILEKQNKVEEAIHNFKLAASYCKNFDLYLNLSSSFLGLHELNESLNCLYAAQRMTPEDKIIQYTIDAIEGSNRPDTAPVDYVKKVFDEYAESFDKNLIEDLEYQAPQELFQLLAQSLNVATHRLNVLDLGCGTGLVGQLMAPYAAELVGVDLSRNMLDKARLRNIYTRLENADLISMMQVEQDSSYDIVTAADVFIYVGKLDNTFAQVQRLLKPQGLFVFSLEALEEVLPIEAHKIAQQDFRLNTTFRYAHSANYINQLAQVNNFTIRHMVPGKVRKNAGIPVAGWYVLCQLTK